MTARIFLSLLGAGAFACLLIGSVPTPSGADSGPWPAFLSRPVERPVTVGTIEELEALATGGDEIPRVWVYFRDKGIASSAELRAALELAGSRLGSREAERRLRRGAPLDIHDLPVPERYLAELETNGAQVHRVSRWLNAASVSASLESVRRLAELSFVSKITPVRGLRSSRGWLADDLPRGREEAQPSLREPGDPFDYGPSRPQLDQIQVIAAHQQGLSGAGVVVAMFDTGYYHDHPAFADAIAQGRLLAQYDFVKDDGETQNEPGDIDSQHNHGTYTWSALGGFYSGELVGPAYGASFLLAKTEDIESETPIEEDNWIAAAEWASGLGADIISTSLSYIDWYVYEDMDGDTAPITIAADLCPSRGLITFASAGNQGDSDWYYIGTPADGDSVVAVGAVDIDNALASWSSHGPTFDGRTKPDLVACGVDVYCAIPPSFADFFWVSGTSLSCPLAAGAAALVLEARPFLSPIQLRDVLRSTADASEQPDNDRGWGLIDVMGALTAAASEADPNPVVAATPSLRVFPNPGSDRFRFSWTRPGGSDPALVLQVFDASGREVFRQESATGSSMEWDGRDASGRPVPAGVYVAWARSGEWAATAQIVRIP